jgi:hypothetical protein
MLVQEVKVACDDFETQVPGRLMALEILMITILRKAGSRRLLAEAEALLSAVEADTLAAVDDRDGQALAVFSVARSMLDKIALELPR